jgi:hypothetical protein
MMHLKIDYNCIIQNYFAILSLMKVHGGKQDYECKEQFMDKYRAWITCSP